MPALKQAMCPACGGPVPIPANPEAVTCPYCASEHLVELDHDEAVLRSTAEIAASIRASGNQLHKDLESLRLSQERAHLLQERAALHSQFLALSETLEDLRRAGVKGSAKQRLGDSLTEQRRQLIEQIRGHEAAIDRLEDALQPARRTASLLPKRATEAPRRHGRRAAVRRVLKSGLYTWFYVGLFVGIIFMAIGASAVATAAALWVGVIAFPIGCWLGRGPDSLARKLGLLVRRMRTS